MTSNPSRLILAISSRALFNLQASDRVFREDGLRAYAEYQVAHEKEPLLPGDAFPLVQKLLALNSGGRVQVEVILLSRNSADTGLRVFNSIDHHQLDITRAAFTGGSPPYRYMGPFGCHLFLSTDPIDVADALDNGMAAASILPGSGNRTDSPHLNFAFDADAVVFSDEAERIYQADGLTAFAENERREADQPL
ncbi:MAG: 5'-nucleotidase, partial [Pseudomonadales bacterium]|nr:5'-nucleotidase [Pseudomonadales bacterium]